MRLINALTLVYIAGFVITLAILAINRSWLMPEFYWAELEDDVRKDGADNHTIDVAYVLTVLLMCVVWPVIWYCAIEARIKGDV